MKVSSLGAQPSPHLREDTMLVLLALITPRVPAQSQDTAGTGEATSCLGQPGRHQQPGQHHRSSHAEVPILIHWAWLASSGGLLACPPQALAPGKLVFLTHKLLRF